MYINGKACGMLMMIELEYFINVFCEYDNSMMRRKKKQS